MISVSSSSVKVRSDSWDVARRHARKHRNDEEPEDDQNLEKTHLALLQMQSECYGLVSEVLMISGLWIESEAA